MSIANEISFNSMNIISQNLTSFINFFWNIALQLNILTIFEGEFNSILRSLYHWINYNFLSINPKFKPIMGVYRSRISFTFGKIEK